MSKPSTVPEQIYQSLFELLIALEAAMQSEGLWSTQSPSPEALASQMPFCCDTLSFQAWLQFVFIPKMNALIKSNASLPATLLLLPMAEETLSSASVPSVMRAIKHIDDFFA